MPLLLEETLEKKIENIGIVFCLIDDKDVFKKYYAKFLAKRLIKGALVCSMMPCIKRMVSLSIATRDVHCQ